MSQNPDIVAELVKALALAEGRLSLLMTEFPNPSETCDHPVATGYVLNRVTTALSHYHASLSNDGWNEWGGGERPPVPEHTDGYLRLCDGTEFQDADIASFNWHHDDKGPRADRRIIAWKLAK